MTTTLIFLWFVVAAALVFDFTNGFHDSANAIATSISTRALSPTTALAMAAVLNVAGGLLSVEVAKTLGNGIVDAAVVTPPVVLAALLGAITWNIITWYFGLPSSSSHALIGGLAGAVIVATTVGAVKWSGVLHKVIIPTVTSPFIGFAAGALLLAILFWTFRRATPGPLNRRFRTIQTISAGLMAFSHGSNDAQKTMGIIALALLAAGKIDHFHVPLWVKLASAGVIGLGTFAGGKRIIRTMGMKMVKLQPIDGFAAETAASGVLLATASMGFPVSTTHVITTAIMGVGATKRFSAVRWGVTLNILVAWILTLPAAALIGGGFCKLFEMVGIL
ncbi:MAG: inorganic phosphate transporter [Myxococcales bacterium]|jgi:phosphate/sulfate permease